MLKLSLTASGLLDKSKLDAWARQKQAAIHKAVATGMQTGGKTVADVRSRVNADFTVRKTGLREIAAGQRVYDRNPDKLPALLIGSKNTLPGHPYQGGTMSGRMLIPLTEEPASVVERSNGSSIR